MNTQGKRILIFCLLCITTLVVYLAFVPRKYKVPAAVLIEKTQFWELKTGSTIAYYLISGKAPKKQNAIIFIQGGPGGYFSQRTIESLLPLSEEGYDVYIYDQIGSGQSARLDNIQDYTVDRHLRDLEEIVNKMDKNKVILLAQSWGAVLATHYVANHPEKVAKIILTGPAAIFPIRQNLANILPPDSLKLRNPMSTNKEANKKINNLRSKVVSKWAIAFGEKLATDSEMDDFQTQLNNELNKSIVCDSSKAPKATGGGGFYVQLMTIKSLESIKDVREKLKNIPTPLLIMKGQCDNQKWGFITEYLDLFANHQLIIIPDAGHSISVEQPEIYIKTIKNFLNQ